MRSALAQRAARLRSSSLAAVPPPRTSQDYSADLASIAASILYQSPLPTQSGLPLYILNAAAFPDSYEVDYDSLLPYVLARLPGEDDLIAGAEYEIVFFAGGTPESATNEKKQGPGLGWYLQAYHVLSRATRKRLTRLWVVHERSWVRVLIEVFSSIVSPKFKKKIIHVNSLSGLALHVPLENLLIPPAVYLHDRRLASDIYVPYVTGRRAFGADNPLPKDYQGKRRLPRVLRETTSFLCQGDNIRMEGVFRIPPQVMIRDIVKEAYDRGQHFIVWKERNTAFVEPGMDAMTLAEVHEGDAYGVHLAAGLIKVWYRELKVPIFPEACYEAIRSRYGSSDALIERDDLTKLFSPSSQESVLPHTNRIILTWHLFPLLSLVASCEDQNKMSAENLAICFSPALVCGSDQMQDAKMTSIIRRLLTEAVRWWPIGLEEACGMSAQEFRAALAPPSSHLDYEDTFQESFRPSQDSTLVESVNRITLNDDEDDSDSSLKPALPPRTSSLPQTHKAGPPVLPRRKPAPVADTLPRYSSLVASSPTSQSSRSTGSPVEMNQPAPVAYEKTAPVQIGIQLATPEKPKKYSTLQESPATRGRTASIQRKPVAPVSPVSSTNTVPTLSEITAQSAQLRSVSGDSAKSNEDTLFVKPTWAASSRKSSTSSIESQPKSAPPLTISKNNYTTTSRIDSGSGSAPSYLPKPRAPSPALLQRMQSWEEKSSDAGSPTKLGSMSSPKKQSVEDLKKLYEERAGAVASMRPLSRQSTGNGGF